MPLRNIYIFQRGLGAELLFWSAYALLAQLAFAPDPLDIGNLAVQGAFTAGEAVAVYGHLRYGLLPLLDKSRGVGTYLLVLLLSVVAGTLLTWLGLAGVALLTDGLDSILSVDRFLRYWLVRVSWSVIMLVALSSGIFLFIHRRRAARRERELETARTQAELAYLRGQLNPHFLFNVLNNIYVLIDHDPERARESLTGFSDLLRYQLYTGEADRVPLAEEIEHLRQYARLSQLRMEEDFSFQLNLAPLPPAHLLPPLLLLPLIENAFRYSPSHGGCVRAKLRDTPGGIEFIITNTVADLAPADREPTTGGIGLTNLRRRLSLLYPGKELLNTQRDATTFTATLKVPTE